MANQVALDVEIAWPYIQKRLTRYLAGVGVGSGGDGTAVGEHALDGPLHTGELARSQAPWVATDIATAIASHAVLPDVHHARIHGMISADHTVTGGAQLDVVGLSAPSTLALLTPSAAPGATSQLLKSSAAGDLTLPTFTATTRVRTPLLDTASGNLSIAPAGGTTAITGALTVSTTATVTTSINTPLITTPTNVDLVINPAGTGAVQFPNDQVLRTSTFDSSFPITGWQINQTVSGHSVLTIGGIQADDLSVRVFVADETRVDRGDEYWTKSYGILATGFTTPASINGTVGITFEDSAAITGAIATNNDWVLFRNADIGTGIDTNAAWGQLSGYTNNGNGTQSWTFTLRNGDTSTAFLKGAIGTIFGASGAALIHLSVVDSAGSPYIKMRRWITNPYTPANYTTYVQLGDLGSIGNALYTPVGDGIYIRSTANEGQFIVADDNGLQLRGASLTLWNGATQTVNISNTGTDIWVGTGSSNKILAWNGSALSLRSNNADVITLDTSGNSFFAGVMTIGTSGEIRQGTGTLGTNYTGLRIWRDTSVGRIGGYNSNTLQWYANTDGKLYAGAGSVWLDAGGVNFNVPIVGTPDYIRFVSSSTVVGSIGMLRSTGPIPDANDGMIFVNNQSTKFRFVGGLSAEFGQDVSVTGNISVSGTVDGVDIAAFKTSYDGHTHAGYLATSGGTLTGTLTARSITFSTDNTYDIGESTKRVQDLYVVNLHAANIVGTPSYAHSHDADYVNVGGDTMTGTLVLAFDNFAMITLDRTANANVDNTWNIGVSYITNATNDYAFFGKSDALQVFSDSSVKINNNTIWHAGNDGAGSGLDADTLDGVQGSGYALTSHNHTGVYVPVGRIVGSGTGLTGGGDLGSDQIISHADTSTQTSITNTNGTVIQSVGVDLMGHVTSLASANLDSRYALTTDLANYVPTSLTVTAGAGLTGGGALSANITISHADTSAQATVTGSGSTFVYGLAVDIYGHVTGITTSDVGTALDGRYVNVSGDTMTGKLTLRESTNEMLVLDSLTATGNPYLSFYQDGTRRSFIQHNDSADTFIITSEFGPISLRPGTAGTEAERLAVTTAGAAVTGTLTVTGPLIAAADTDAILTTGRAIVGYATGSDSASFSHYDHNSSTNYGLAQSAAGATKLNSAAGQALDLAIAGAPQFTVNVERMTPRSSGVMSLGDYNRKFGMIHATGLAVTTLVADEVIATVGGQILVSETTKLIADISSGGSVGGTDVLYTSMTGYWSLDETSGTRLDSLNTSHLADKNTVASNTGKLGTAAQFVRANSERLTTASNSALAVGDIDFYISCWVYATDDDGNTHCVLSKGGGSGDRAFALNLDWSDNRFEFVVYNSSNVTTTVNSSVTVSVNNWYHVECWHNAASNVIGVSVNGTDTTTAHTTGVKVDTGQFTVGALGFTNYFSGRVDEIYFAKNYIPDNTRRTWLRNSGNGRTFTDIYNYGVGVFTIDVEHNFLQPNDYVYMQTAPAGIPQFEVFQITSSYSAITGGYRYSAVRDLDGSGANAWYVGDAVTSLGGNPGEGYINLTATATLHGHYGPTIIHYVRTSSSTWDAVKPVVASGNLRSFVDYDEDIFGHAAGNDLTLTPAAGFKGYTIDTDGGFRGFNLDIELYEEETLFLSIGTVSGIQIETNDVVSNDNRSVSFNHSGDLRGYLRGFEGMGTHTVALVTEAVTDTNSRLALYCSTDVGFGSTKTATVDISAFGVHSATVTVGGGGTAAAAFVEIDATTIIANAELDMAGNNIIDIGSIGTSWAGLSFATGWENYNSGYEQARYKKVGDLVFVQGLVKRTSGSSLTIGTLPVGYRPPERLLLHTEGSGGTQRIDVLADGTIVVQSSTATSFVSLCLPPFSTL